MKEEGEKTQEKKRLAFFCTLKIRFMPTSKLFFFSSFSSLEMTANLSWME